MLTIIFHQKPEYKHFKHIKGNNSGQFGKLPPILKAYYPSIINRIKLILLTTPSFILLFPISMLVGPEYMTMETTKPTKLH